MEPDTLALTLQLSCRMQVIIDDLSNSNIEVLDGIEKITGIRPEFIKLDLKDKEGTREALKAHPGINGIILFAASKAVGESVQQPLKYYRNNWTPFNFKRI